MTALHAMTVLHPMTSLPASNISASRICTSRTPDTARRS